MTAPRKRRRLGTTSTADYRRVSWRLDARVVERIEGYAAGGFPMPGTTLGPIRGLGEGVVAEALLTLGIAAVEHGWEPPLPPLVRVDVVPVAPKGPDTRRGERKALR